MPINNSYSQTPKRIFTNKPFIKGMSYTNADLDPFVCRAVANVELESSNSATKTRLGMVNSPIGSNKETAYAFYNKYILFSNFVLEDDYATANTINATTFGIRVLDKDLKEHSIFNTIITNNTKLIMSNNELITEDATGYSTSNKVIYALKMNEGDIPHCINNEDYSFLFFGIIKNKINNTLIYKGIIKIFYHTSADTIIIETITPDIVDNFTVTDYGVNILSDNPSIYKDYVTFTEHDFYKDYMGETDNTPNVIDVLTVAMYDSPVACYPYTVTNNANMIKGVDKLSSDEVYIRPYVAMPNGTNYGAIVKANNNYGSEMYYNFSTDTFEFANINTVTGNSIENITIPTRFSQNSNTYSNSVELYRGDTASTVSKIELPNIDLLSVNSTSTDVLSDDPDYADYFSIKQTDAIIYKQHIGTASYNTPAMPFEQTYNFTGSKIEYSYYESINLIKAAQPNHNVRHTINRNPSDGPHVSMYAASDGSEGSNGVWITCPIVMKVYDPVGDSSFNLNYLSNINMSGNIYIFFYNFDGEGHYIQFTLSYDSVDLSNLRYTPTVIYKNDTHKHCTLDFGYIDIKLIPTEVITNGPNTAAPNYMLNMLLKSTLASISDTSTNIAYTTGSYVPDHKYSSKCYVPVYNKFNISGTSSISYSYALTMSPSNRTGFINNPTSTPVDNILSMTIKNQLSTYGPSNDTVTLLNTYVDYDFSDSTEIAEAYSGCILDSTHNIVYEYDDINTELNLSDAVNIIKYGALDTSFATIKVTSSSSKSGIYETYVKRLNNDRDNKNFNINVKQSAFYDINGSTIKISVFPITSSTSTGTPPETYFFEDSSMVTKPLYAIRTDKLDVVNHTEIAYNNRIKNTAVRVCNHLGHVVLWGDDTNSNSLYYSEYGNPAYFPSNYVITFNNPIVYAYPHNGNLIVFTTDDIYMLHSGNVPSTTNQDGSEIAFTQTLIQSNTRLGKDNIHTVRSIGKDVFFINNNNNGYLLKANKYVSNVSDVYLIRVTNQINDLLNDPFNYAKERYNKWNPNASSDTTQHLNIEYVKYSYADDIAITDPTTIHVIDGDTISYNNVSYRFADIDTPEIAHEEYGNNSYTTDEYLGQSAKILLQQMINSSSQIKILDTGNLAVDGVRHMAYVSMVINEEEVSVNATMLYNGLAEFSTINHNATYHNFSHICYSLAKQLHNGLHNKYIYKELTNDYTGATEIIDISVDTYCSSWNPNNFRLYTYTTNSYIYIFQSIKLSIGKAITIIYKYNIDSKVWTTYDVLGYIQPQDIINDYNILGFKVLTNNDDGLFGYPSVITFKDKQDILNISYNITNDNNYTLSNQNVTGKDINVYFDSGNQSISLMNDKLFREIKLSLGSLPDSLLNMKYSIDLYVDGKLVIPNQPNSCKHIHQNPINTHYKGIVENASGFQKITFFAPARGRIPRIVFSLDCSSDVNILEYAIVYMQLNAK